MEDGKGRVRIEGREVRGYKKVYSVGFTDK